MASEEERHSFLEKYRIRRGWYSREFPVTQRIVNTEKLDLPKIVPEEEDVVGNPWLDAASYVDLVHEDFSEFLCEWGI